LKEKEYFHSSRNIDIMKHLFLAISFGLLFFSCKHSHQPASETLKKAYAIQKEALEVDKKIQSIISNSDSIDIDLIEKRKLLISNMVEISGMDHDHSNCSHDHKPKTIELSDEDMLKVQTEWKDSLLSLLKQVQ
jgi:hypothetical protein